jgi:hypothetical protein
LDPSAPEVDIVDPTLQGTARETMADCHELIDPS